MKKNFIIIVRHSNFEEIQATTDDYSNAVEYALRAIVNNKGKIVKIR